ncbi:MAG: hypothetical protein ABIP93_06565 [Gemmatimonadaceae bacterium]
MAILALLSGGILLAALAAVWRARDRGPSTKRMSLLVLLLAIVAVGLGWYIIRGG